MRVICTGIVLTTAGVVDALTPTLSVKLRDSAVHSDTISRALAVLLEDAENVQQPKCQGHLSGEHLATAQQVVDDGARSCWSVSECLVRISQLSGLSPLHA